jgi:hypothetical protein
MWAYFGAYAEAMRDVLGLTGLPCWEKYQSWEDAAKEGGLRYMHEEFCMVSDFPEVIKVNDRNLPHSTNGPSHRWRDGFEIYHLNGVRFPKDMYYKITSDMDDEAIPAEWRLTAEEKAKYILAIEDIDQRTQALRYLPPKELIQQLKGKLLDSYEKIAVDGTTVEYGLYKLPKGDTFTEEAYYMYFNCPSTGKEHMEGVDAAKTVPEAMAWREEISEEMWKLKVPILHET